MTKKNNVAADYGGYINIYRSIREDPFYKQKPFSKGHAWVDLLILANYTDVKDVAGDHVKVYERGKIYRSMQWLADEWGWDRRKVKRFLMALESDGKVSVEVLRGGTTNGCVITVVNYGKFQYQGYRDGTTDGTTDGTQIKKNKKDKKRKKDARAREGETPRDADDRKVIPMPEDIRRKFDEAF